MTKRLFKPIAAITAIAVLCGLFSACGNFEETLQNIGDSAIEIVGNAIDSTYESEDEKYEKVITEFLAVLDSKDKTALKSLFSKTAQEKDKNLDKSIDTLFEKYDGTNSEYYYDGGLGGSYHNEYGTKSANIGTTFPVMSGDNFYWCYIRLTYRDDFDENNIGIEYINFYSADFFCAYRYDEVDYIYDEENNFGLNVYMDYSADFTVKSVGGYPYKYTDRGYIDESEAKAFLEEGNGYNSFVQKFGEPCAIRNYYIYELKPIDNEPRYLQLCVDEESFTIYSASVLDELEWIYSIFDMENETDEAS